MKIFFGFLGGRVKGHCILVLHHFCIDFQMLKHLCRYLTTPCLYVFGVNRYRNNACIMFGLCKNQNAHCLHIVMYKVYHLFLSFQYIKSKYKNGSNQRRNYEINKIGKRKQSLFWWYGCWHSSKPPHPFTKGRDWLPQIWQ